MNEPMYIVPEDEDAVEIRRHVSDQDFSTISQFLRDHRQAESQTLRLLAFMEDHAESLEIPVEIGEIILGADDNDKPQLEVYARVNAPHEEFRQYCENVYQWMTRAFAFADNTVYPVILRTIEI